MGNKGKRKSERKHRKKRARSSSSSSSSSTSSRSGLQTPSLPPRARKRLKVSHTNDAGIVSTTSSNITLNNMIPDFDPLTDNISAWLNIIQSYAVTFSWNDSMIRYQALNKLKGSAKIWYDSLLRTEHAWTTWLWVDWKKKISSTFTVKRNMFELLRELIDRKPLENQSLYDFYFEQKAKIDGLCLNFSEQDIVSIILGNIGDSNITASVEASNPISCEGLAGFLHSRVFRSKSTKQIGSNIRDSSNGRDNTVKLTPLVQNTVSQKSASTSMLSAPLPNSLNQTGSGQGRRVIECYNCGGNHRRVDCSIKCDFCGKRGHTEPSCFHKKKSNVEKADKTDN